MSRIRINRFSDPARGGRRVEVKTLDRYTTVVQPLGIVEETHRKVWQDIGTLMDPVQNHIKEQPTSYAAKMLAAHNRGVAA